MRKNRTYRAKSVKNMEWKEVVKGRERQAAHVGVDVGKRAVLAVVRWNGDEFERPWLVKNPDEIRQFVGLLVDIKRDWELTVAMEPTGTYGDVLRQALSDAGFRTERVSPKVAHDYAEVFDGVPSQFDGKDAAVVAELAALGKSQEWKYETPSVADQEMAYWVDWMDAQRRQAAMWLGRLEALLRATLAGSHTMAEAVVADFVANPPALRRSQRIGRRSPGSAPGSALGRPLHGGREDSRTRGECARNCRRTTGADRHAADAGIRGDGVGGSRGTCARQASVDGTGTWQCGHSGTSSRGRRGDGLRAVDSFGRSARVFLCGGLPQSDGHEPDGVQQRRVSGTIAHQ